MTMKATVCTRRSPTRRKLECSLNRVILRSACGNHTDKSVKKERGLNNCYCAHTRASPHVFILSDSYDSI